MRDEKDFGTARSGRSRMSDVRSTKSHMKIRYSEFDEMLSGKEHNSSESDESV